MKFIEEWIQKPIEQINLSLKATSRIKELNDMVNIDLECVDYRKKAVIHVDESEKNDMKGKYECIETMFHQWSQAEIQFFYLEIWQKERRVYEA